MQGQGTDVSIANTRAMNSAALENDGEITFLVDKLRCVDQREMT